jgi:hypothetical protein
MYTRGTSGETTARRYLLRGPEVPRIYHGTLSQLTQALSDAMRESVWVDGTCEIVAVYSAGEQYVIRVYSGGELIWTS